MVNHGFNLQPPLATGCSATAFHLGFLECCGVNDTQGKLIVLDAPLFLFAMNFDDLRIANFEAQLASIVFSALCGSPCGSPARIHFSFYNAAGWVMSNFLGLRCE